MTTNTRSAIPSFALAGISLVLSIAKGVEWLGEPLRLVHLLTIIGLSMFTGVTWMQAVFRLRQGRSGGAGASAA